MKVCIYGAGAVGCFLAGRLAKGGAEVSAVARGNTLEGIRANGIRIETPDYSYETMIKVSEKPEDLGEQDYVVVTVKSPALPEIVDGLAKLIGPKTKVVFVMNGIPWWFFYDYGGDLAGRRLEKLDPGGKLWSAVGPERVIGGILFCSCDLLKPGHVHAETAGPNLYLGEPSGEETDSIATFADAVRGDTLGVKIVPDIRTTIWSKIQLNMSSGLLGCLSNCPPQNLYSNAACRDVVRKIVNEAGAIAKALGCETGVDADQLIERTKNQGHRSSIVQDLDAGRPMEIDPTFAIPLEMARMTGVETPTLDFLLCLVKARAQRIGSYPAD